MDSGPFSRRLQRSVQTILRTRALELLEPRIALTASADVTSNAPALAALATTGPTASPLATVSYPGGVTVTSTQILTEEDIIPRFVANPTVTSIKSGNWSDPTIWSTGQVPTDNDRVMIPANITIQYSSLSSVHLNGMEIDGSLIFSTTVNTQLIVGNLTVMPTGTLQIGTAANPLPASLKAEIVIADQPLNLVTDPRQFGTGLIALGTVSIHGAAPSTTWIGLAAEPHAGDSSLTVSSPVTGWQPGSTLILPDTRQDGSSASPQWEQVTIDHVVGNQIFLTAPLQFDHLGARNTSGVLELLPDVALLDRNVVIRSENPLGTRGHVFFTARANIDVEDARFQDLGRTDALRPLDNSTFDANGNVTHVGTNQVGRYAVHFHHVMGPANATNTGYQFKFVGNTVDGSRKWAVAIHDSDFGLLDGNVIYNAQGAGFVTEEGTEIGNIFSNNITIRMQGTGSDGKDGTQQNDYGRGGSGFWFRRGGNTVTGNVAADSTFAGFVIDGYFSLAPMTLPKFRGADPMQPDQNIVTAMSPDSLWMNNEAYGMSTNGLWAAFISGGYGGTQPTVLFQNLRLWNISSVGVDIYYTNGVTFDGLLVLADPSTQDVYSGVVGMFLRTYPNRNLVVENSRIEGAQSGIVTPTSDASIAGDLQPTIIRNTTLKNYINILVSPAMDNLDGGNGNALEVRDVNFTMISLPRGSAPASVVIPPANISMNLKISNGASPYPVVALTQPSVVNVYNYNGVAGDNFQVFYKEQAASFVMPQTTSSLLTGVGTGTIGSPAAGRTNAQNWKSSGLAVAGAVAPASATARTGITGLVAPLQSTSSVRPQVVLVTPFAWTQVPSAGTVRIRYNVNGTLPAGSSVYLMIDNSALLPVTQDRYYPFQSGTHLIRAFIGDANGLPIPGTIDAVRYFVVGGTPTATSPAVSQSGSAVTAAMATALANPAPASMLGAQPSHPLVTATTGPQTPSASTAPSATVQTAKDGFATAISDLAVENSLTTTSDELIAQLADVQVRLRHSSRGGAR